MNPLRVVGLSAIYLLLFSTLLVYHTVRTLAVAQPDELIWYLSEFPPERLIAAFFMWVISNPVIALVFLQMGIQALILGFVTDWGIQVLRRRIRIFNR
jgi:hypothetical protein